MLTDNGMAFADLPKYRQGPSRTWLGPHIFDRTCIDNAIEHKLTSQARRRLPLKNQGGSACFRARHVRGFRSDGNLDPDPGEAPLSYLKSDGSFYEEARACGRQGGRGGPGWIQDT